MSTTAYLRRETGIHLAVYFMLIFGAIGAFLLIKQAGQNLTPPASMKPITQSAAPKAVPVDVVLHVLATLAAIIALGNFLAWIFRWIGQPAVIGEVVAGIALGPSLLGAISPDVMHWLIPAKEVDPQGLVITSLKMIAQLAVVLYMFIIGLELNTHQVGRHAKAAVAISHASIVFPFVLGSTLALWLYPRLSESNVTFTNFALFLGVAMSITAFPVLARILTDQKMERTDLGVVALSCAATDDATAWCLLAFVVGVAQAKIENAFLVIGLTLVYMAVMIFVIRPLARHGIQWAESRKLDRQITPILFIAVLVSSLITDAIGIHAVFGAFLLGAVIPHDSRIAEELGRKLTDVVTILLLPAFFAVTGMNTRIGLITGWENWMICGLIILVATLGKWGGTVAASRFVGLDWKTSNALGVLMNTRGLMELIVLNIGLSLGVITPKLFAMMVIMAIVTTVATAPILRRLAHPPVNAPAP